MSSNNSRQSVATVPRKSYTAVGSFGLSLFTYDYGLNPQTLVEQGILTAVGTSADCPAGRTLYENGKKIVPTSAPFPPILTVSLSTGSQPLTSYMVGVFDPQSGLSGFIDPNSVNFAINSTDLPVFLNNDIGRGPSTDIKNSGNPVVTNGNILSLVAPPGSNEAPLPNYVGVAVRGVDYLNAGPLGNGGNDYGIFAAPYALAINNGFNSGSFGLATGQGGDPSTTNWAGMYASGDVYFTGNLYTKRTAGTATLAYGGTPGSAAIVTVSNVAIGSANALVFLTHRGNAGNRGVLSYQLVASGGVGPANDLVITSSNTDDRSEVNWFIVNASIGID